MLGVAQQFAGVLQVHFRRGLGPDVAELECADSGGQGCDSDEALFDRDEKLRRTIHAEENALLFAGRPVEGCTIYVTHPPCARCAAKLIQSGLTRVVAQMPAEEFGERWADDMRSASAMFLEAGVGFEYLEPQQ